MHKMSLGILLADKVAVPLGSGKMSCSLSHSEIFLIPKLHKILLRSVEFISMSWIVNVSISQFLL